jgi:hypothetical protein
MEDIINIKHMMFLRRLSLDQIKNIIQTSKYDQSIQIEENHTFNIIGMESNIINLEDYNRFYSIAEYIGKVQINLYNLWRI